MQFNLTKKAILKSENLLNFNKPRAIITVSVGQPNHEGDKFLSTLLAANKQFSFVRIMVCDSLQRYTMKITSGSTIEKLHLESMRLGQEWIKRNLNNIEKLTIPYQISRWDEWLNHPDFDIKLQFIIELYANDALFQDSIYKTVRGFITRNPERLLVPEQTAYELSKDYLLEECAVMLILAEEGFEFEIYPSQRNEALDYIYKTIISDENPQLMQAVSIKFKNISYNSGINDSTL